MPKNTKFLSLSLLVCFAFTIIASLAPVQTANASIWPLADSADLINSTCPAGASQFPELTLLKVKIAEAETVDQARAMALEPTEEAIDALDNANKLMPNSDELRAAQNRISEGRARILLAANQTQVADEFSGMMLAGLDDDRAAHLGVGKASCNYSSGELIAIVIGLILGSIPGLILLVVLC